MTPQEQLKAFKDISEALITIRRENIRTLARTKALEAMIRNSLPKEKRVAWHDMLDKQTKFILQKLFESFEKQNPGFAASLDDRQDWEISDEA